MGPSFDPGRAPYRREVTFAAVKTPNGRSADAAQERSGLQSETANGGSGVVEGITVAGTWRTAVARLARLRPAWKGLVAYALYQMITFLVWAVPILPRFGTQHVIAGLQDARYFQWALSWTPWGLFHHVDPLHSSYVFAPNGVSLAWSTFVPGPALVMWPVSATFGPLVSLNLLKVMAPALASWAAYLACHRLTHRFWPSIVGGYLFGYSAYVLGNMGFLNLILVFPIPILLYLTIRDVEGSLGPVAFVAGSSAALVGLFSISTEVFATSAIFGGVAFLGAFVAAPDLRARLLQTGSRILLSGAIAALILMPYLWSAVANRPAVLHGNDLAAADVWSLIVPPRELLVGGTTFAPFLSRVVKFPVGSGLGYVGPAVFALLVGFAITERRRRGTWPLLAFVACVMILTLGKALHVGGESVAPLPGRVLASVPIVRLMVPSRLAVFSALAVGVIAALWLSRASGPWAWVRWVVALGAVVSLLPSTPNNPASQVVPAFLSSSELRAVIPQGENVYAIPFQKGDEMVWQATAQFWFALAEGYVGVLPDQLRTGEIARGLSVRRGRPQDPQEFARWMLEHGASAVILDDRAATKYGEMLQGAGYRSFYTGGGVSVWRMADTSSAPARGVG